MKVYITAQQLNFYAQHSYIGFTDLPLDPFKEAIALALQKDSLPRELWRKNPSLERLITQVLGPMALQLSNRKKLYLALDAWISSKEEWDTGNAVQNRLSFQNLAIVACIPQDASPCFFMHPSCWPSLFTHFPFPRPDCYLVAFGGAESLYILNPKDLHNSYYKKWGFVFGDSIQKNPCILG